MGILSDFKKMHEQRELLFLPNAWDVLSALILEQSGFKAIGTTSKGVANYMGQEDGEKIQFDELLTLVHKMVSAVEIPITVDIESGYSENIKVVANNALNIAELGAVGINIEDSLKNDAGLHDKNRQCELIGNIRKKLDSNGYDEFFINARVDTYLHHTNPLDETIERSVDYVARGADGIFVPGVYRSSEIEKLVESIGVPLNVMSLPNLTDTASLNKLGVKRFSIGNAFSDATISFVEKKAQILFTQQSTENLYVDCSVKTLFE